jgi:hypothetical protein
VFESDRRFAEESFAPTAGGKGIVEGAFVGRARILAKQGALFLEYFSFAPCSISQQRKRRWHNALLLSTQKQGDSEQFSRSFGSRDIHKFHNSTNIGSVGSVY